ncbi:MAG: nitrilase-related carbon-nitrogen hydrolase [Acidimicrobiales bacterium]
MTETPFGCLGTLTSWENYMPLARAALYAQGVDIYLAPTWDSSDVWIATLRHVAKEGRVFVIRVNRCIRVFDVPEDVPHRSELYGSPDDWLTLGNSAIVNPDGEILAGPLVREDGILYADVDPKVVRSARQQFDAVGHYARPDVLRLVVDTSTRPSVSFASPEAP